MLGIPIGASLGMIALTFLASGVNYASNIVFSRVLTPSAFGDFTALLALAVIVAVPAGAAQTIAADRLAGYTQRGDDARIAYFIRHAAAHVTLYAVVIGVLYAAAVPFVADAMNLQSVSTAAALAPMLVLGFLTPVAFGVLQGLERYLVLGFAMLWIAVSRILFGVPWAISDFGTGPGGALLGQAVGNVTALVAIAWVIRRHLVGRGTGAATAGVRRQIDSRTIGAAGAFVGFAFLSNFDVVLAKLVLDATAAGEYAALATIEKIILFLPASIALLMVPNAAKQRANGGSAGNVLRVSACLVLVTTVVVAAPAVVAPEWVITTMFGAEYASASAGVVPITLAGAGLALTYLLVVYTVALRDRRWVGLLVVGMLFQAGSILMFHDSPSQVATAQAITVWAVLLGNELLFHPITRSAKRRFGTTDSES